MSTAASSTRQVVIAGGGPAALEAALALQRLAGARVAITLLTPDPEFVYRPLSVAEPFGAGPPRSFSVSALAADRGFGLRHDALARVEAERRCAVTAAGETLTYDALVLALGARAVEAVPGAVTFRGAGDAARLKSALASLDDSRASRVAFVAGTETAWTLPIYELALLGAAWAEGRNIVLEPWLVTHEQRPLSVFGAQASADVAELLDHAGVRLWTGAAAESVEDGRLWLTLEGGLPVDLAIALPRLVGRRVPGLPHDAQGFTPVDRLGRVPDVPDVYAVGDMTSRPLKQGGLAAQQADATATALAAWAGADVEPSPYEPQLRAVLLTGREPRYLRRLEESGRLSSEASLDPPWWPPHKIAARHLGPYLAAHPELEIARAA